MQDVVLAKPEMSFPALDTEPPAAADKRESSDAGSDDASHLQRTSVYDSVTSAESKSPFQRLPQDHSSSIRYCATKIKFLLLWPSMLYHSVMPKPYSDLHCTTSGQLALLGLMLA